MRKSAASATPTLNESPSEKEGKSDLRLTGNDFDQSLNESPSEKEGKCFPGRRPRPCDG